jgi:hypothetical protein
MYSIYVLNQNSNYFSNKLFSRTEKLCVLSTVEDWISVYYLEEFFDSKCYSSKYSKFLILSYNSNKSPTRCNSFPVYYPDIYLQPNMFRAFSRPSSGAHDCRSKQPLVLPSYRGDSRAVFVVGPVITCWAVNKYQDNKLEHCCIWLVIYLNCTRMHGLTNLKFS